jgi:hypothetical protein
MPSAPRARSGFGPPSGYSHRHWRVPGVGQEIPPRISTAGADTCDWQARLALAVTLHGMVRSLLIGLAGGDFAFEMALLVIEVLQLQVEAVDLVSSLSGLRLSLPGRKVGGTMQAAQV